MSWTGDAYEDDSPPWSDLEDDEARDSGAALPTQNLQVEESSPEYEARENRFVGSASAWEYHTRSERGLIDSILQQQANDLSAHLYNAHALKLRLRDAASASEAKPWVSKTRWDRTNQDGSSPWQPDRHWVAWPLHPEDVPRREEQFGAPLPDPSDVEATFRKPELFIPSTDLREELEALTLKAAKDRFLARDWTTQADTDEMPAASPGVERATATGTSRDDGDDSAARSLLDDTDAHDELVFLADDIQASVTLQQPIRHIITKLDDLLLGLHKSRAGHRSLRATSRSRSRSRSALRNESINDKAANVSGDAADQDAELTADRARPGSAGTSTSGKHQSGAHLLADHGLRDWSEVLGIASLVGWNSDIIDRAARRCASLFGESMAFRTMPETSAGASEDLIVQYVPDMILPLESESEDNVASPVDESSAVSDNRNEWRCPYAECARHHAAYEKGFRWREHLKKKHQHSRAEIDDIEQNTYPGRGEGVYKVKLPEYPCPLQDCKHHDKPFAVRYRWADHLRRGHKYPEAQIDDAEQALRRTSEAACRATSRARSSPGTDVEDPSYISTDNEDLGDEQSSSMAGGVHVDGFMAAIDVRLYQRGRSKKRKNAHTDEEQSLSDGWS